MKFCRNRKRKTFLKLLTRCRELKKIDAALLAWEKKTYKIDERGYSVVTPFGNEANRELIQLTKRLRKLFP